MVSEQIITSLHAEFSMTDLGSLNYFLGIFVTRNASGMFLSQQKYATEVLDRAGMLNCKPCRTPVDTDSKLSADGAPISDSTLYRSLAGALQYLTFTRPDISYAVQQVCLFMHDPREPHLSALKRILRYVRGTLSYGLQLYSSTTSSLVAYSDADWAGCPTTRRSTSGYCVFLGNNLLSWSSKRQFTLSRSSAEAEYRGVANAVAETCWLRNLLRELHTPLATATLVYCDNVSAVYLSSNPVQHQRTKHIEIDIHFVRDLVATGAIRVLHVPSRYQYADIFTKGLPTSLFDEFRTSLSVRSSPAPTAGGSLMDSLMVKDWSNRLDDALWSFRTAYKTPLGTTPYRIVYGKACHLHIEPEHRPYSTLKECNMDMNKAGENRLLQHNKLDELRLDAYESSLSYKERMKRWHDKHMKPPVKYAKGDKVLLYNSRLKLLPGKLKSGWYGPFTVSRTLKHGAIKLVDNDGKEFTVNKQRVKHYQTDTAHLDADEDILLEKEGEIEIKISPKEILVISEKRLCNIDYPKRWTISRGLLDEDLTRLSSFYPNSLNPGEY
ncbi:ribonuclease H-like domain-containing protein [Tanacetum coccineum]